MNDRTFRILLVEPDPQMLEALAACLSRRFNAQVTCVADGVSAMNTEMAEPNDLVILERSLVGEDGLALAERLCALSRRPVLLLCDDADGDELIQAMRMGVCDVFRKPFAVEELLDCVQRALHAFETRRQSAVRYRKMREMVRRVIRERRDLNRRIELVCRDLVESHRRLAFKVIEFQKPQASQSTV